MRVASLFSFLLVALAGCGTTAATDGGDKADAAMTPEVQPDLAVAIDIAMVVPTCTDGKQNGRETDVDCGGADCPACPIGKHCLSLFDCQGRLCSTDTNADGGAGGLCNGPTCTDHIKNGDETGVDCGGSCKSACRAGEGCVKNADCSTLLCAGGTCQQASCGDGIKNGSETDVDCGGGACEQCGPGKGCGADVDCYTKLCDAFKGVCIGCGDGIKNGTESDVDCGGMLCVACTLGKTCTAHRDCASLLCSGGVCTSCQQDGDCPFKICKSGACTNAPIVGVFSGETYFKVQVMGPMTDTNVYDACKANGLVPPCQAQGMCMYSDAKCGKTQEMMCGNPMSGLANAICNGQSPPNCPLLYGVYQYMGHAWVQDSACGAEQGNWCVQGSTTRDRFALCVM